MTKTSKARIETLSLTVLEALDQAFDATTQAAAACCLQTAVAAAKQLVTLGGAGQELLDAMNETRAALMARGWC